VLDAGERLDDAAALDLFTGAAARLRGETAPFGVVAGARADLLVAEPDRATRPGLLGRLRVRHALSGGEVIT
jgi:hypothetical protein